MADDVRSFRKLPPFLYILAVIGFLFLILPMAALLAKVPWTRFWFNINKPEVLLALKVSIYTSLLIAVCAAILGIPLAYLLARGPTKLTKLIHPFVVSALVFPPTVAGLALAALLSETGVFGKLIFNITGWVPAGSTLAVVLAGLFVGMPFLVVVVQASFEGLETHLEESAASDGATRSQIFRKIVLPQSKIPILAGMFLTWARALGEFGATMTFAGAFPGKTFTTAMQIYADLKIDSEAAYCLSALMLTICLSVIFLARSNWLPYLKK
ncbi:MAG: ABC transporter permease [Acidobacteria bacterium]|nr:ABC transporter permease [Acidobacteriota bacterium]